MRIAIVSKLWEKTSPYSTGGTGASIGNLVNGLVDRGHQVTLFATGDSRTKAQKLIAARKKPFHGDYSEIQEYENIANAFRRHREFDLIHCAVEHKSLLLGDLVSTPSLHSIRYGEFFKQELDLLKKNKRQNYVANSHALTDLLPFLSWRGVVYNGLDLKKFSFNDRPHDYLLFLARLSPQKGPDIAIKAAIRSGQRLILAGKLSAIDKKFLEDRVFPFVDGKRIIYLGEADFRAKLNLLKYAKALLQPVRFFEACSNTIIEAMACGTPTIAFDLGSNSELIDDHESGFIVSTPEQMIRAVKKIEIINRSSCRRRAEEKFSLQTMTAGYEKIYRKLVRKHDQKS